MNNVEIEKTINSLKGVAGLLLMMSQSPEDIPVWRDWVLDLPYQEVKKKIEILEEIDNYD